MQIANCKKCGSQVVSYVSMDREYDDILKISCRGCYKIKSLYLHNNDHFPEIIEKMHELVKQWNDENIVAVQSGGSPAYDPNPVITFGRNK